MSRPAAALRIALLAATLAAAACAAPRHALPPSAEDLPIRQTLAEGLAGRYPAQFRGVQRLALYAAGKQYDLMGYLVVTGPDTLRAVALGEMGGRIFDLSLQGGAPAILKKPETMPPRPLLEGVVGDLRHLFLPPRDGLALAREADGAPALVAGDERGRAVEYAFGADGQLARSVESEGGRVLREVGYADYRRFDGFDRPVPSRLVVENRRWRYRLEVETLELHAGPPPSAGADE